MAYNYEYPYVDPNNTNTDWMLNELKKVDDKIAEVPAIAKAEVQRILPGINLKATYHSSDESITLYLEKEVN